MSRINNFHRLLRVYLLGRSYWLSRLLAKMSSNKKALICSLLLCQACLTNRGFAQQQPANIESNPGSTPIASMKGSSKGQQGGSAQADFDSLIDLIQSTVAVDTWLENGTGEGEILPFAINGVYADAVGTLRFKMISNQSSALKKPLNTLPKNKKSHVRDSSDLRYISLPRLETAIRKRQLARQPLAPEMLTLAGLERIEYLFISPESGDLILAGPADDWHTRPVGIIVSLESCLPVFRLDDLLTLWRRKQQNLNPAFGCSFIPRQEALGETQRFLQANGDKPLDPNRHQQWLQDLRTCLGKQQVQFF